MAIVRATTLEIASEPLALLLTMSALALVTVASALHYHQFGESSRMARDAGLSALLVGGLFHTVFCTIRTFRRELESGTLQMALAHSVSRRGFFLSKAVGSFLAYLLFALTVFGVTVTTVNGAEIGGRIALENGDVARMYGPSLALALVPLVMPPIVGALLNRFASFRFVRTSTLLALALAWVGPFFHGDFALLSRLIPAGFMLLLPAAVFVAAAATFSVRLRDNAAASACGLLFLAALPALGNYYLSDALAKGGVLPWSHVALAVAVTVPTIAALLLLGISLFERTDVAEGEI